MTRPAPENRARLDALANALLEQETLEEEDAYAAAGVTRPQATPRRARRGGALQDVNARSSNGAAGCLAASRDEQLAHRSVAPG
jgi:cell division protease FtsH